MILARETISKRNSLPVELQYILVSEQPRYCRWFVDCLRYGGKYFDSFEDAESFIRERKLAGSTKIKALSSIKEQLLREAETKLAELDRIEEIRNTSEYRGAKEICKIRQQLKFDGVANSERDANMLILLHYLREKNL